MTADRSTVNGWLRKLEKAADEHEPGDTWRAFVFREILHKAWTDGWARGHDDHRDDTHEAQRAVRRAVKETEQ